MNEAGQVPAFLLPRGPQVTDAPSTEHAIGALTAEVAMLKTQLAVMQADLREVHDAVIESRGGRRMGFMILTAVGVLGGFVGAFGHWLVTAR